MRAIFANLAAVKFRIGIDQHKCNAAASALDNATDDPIPAAENRLLSISIFKEVLHTGTHCE